MSSDVIKTVEIGENTFDFRHISPLELNAILIRTIKALGGALSDIDSLDLDISFLTKSLHTVDEKVIEKLQLDILSSCFHKGSGLLNKGKINALFTGGKGLIDFWKLTIEAYKVYFSDFFDGASDLLGDLDALQNNSTPE